MILGSLLQHVLIVQAYSDVAHVPEDPNTYYLRKLVAKRFYGCAYFINFQFVSQLSRDIKQYWLSEFVVAPRTVRITYAVCLRGSCLANTFVASILVCALRDAIQWSLLISLALHEIWIWTFLLDFY